MSTPKTDEAAIRQIVRALHAAGFPFLEVYDGEEMVQARNESEAVAAVTAVDDATLFVHDPESGRNPWVRFVLGNDPEEVVADWTIDVERFDRTITSVTDRWWNTTSGFDPDVYDLSGSASRQHYIDTGEYLKHGES